MFKQKVAIMFVGLLCFSSVTGFSTVICHGSDGHVALEALVHDHCECPETDEGGRHNEVAVTMAVSSADHGHCIDYMAGSDLIIQTRGTIQFPSHKVFTANFILKQTSAHTPSVFSRFFTWNNDTSSFYAPLRTIVLLA